MSGRLGGGRHFFGQKRGHEQPQGHKQSGGSGQGQKRRPRQQVEEGGLVGHGGGVAGEGLAELDELPEEEKVGGQPGHAGHVQAAARAFPAEDGHDQCQQTEQVRGVPPEAHSPGESGGRGQENGQGRASARTQGGRAGQGTGDPGIGIPAAGQTGGQAEAAGQPGDDEKRRQHRACPQGPADAGHDFVGGVGKDRDAGQKRQGGQGPVGRARPARAPNEAQRGEQEYRDDIGPGGGPGGRGRMEEEFVGPKRLFQRNEKGRLAAQAGGERRQGKRPGQPFAPAPQQGQRGQDQGRRAGGQHAKSQRFKRAPIRRGHDADKFHDIRHGFLPGADRGRAWARPHRRR